MKRDNLSLLAAMALLFVTPTHTSAKNLVEKVDINSIEKIEEAKESISPAQQFINKTLKNDPNLSNAVVGICAIDENGKKIAGWNSNMPMLTASTMKTVTTGLALITLGPDYKFSTKVGYTGTIKDGVLNGDIHIIGGGDPTLGSKDTVAFAIDSIFGVWANAISNKGIKKINGDIVVDDSYFERELMHGSWEWDDFGTYYGSAPSGLSFCENVQYYTLKPGAKVGDKAEVIAEYPTIPGLDIVNNVITGEPGTGDNTIYYVQDIELFSEYRGTLGVDRGVVDSDNSNRFPQLSCGYHFGEFLKNKGINYSSKIVDIVDLKAADNYVEPEVISETFSPELYKIVNVTNRISNNMYAETLLKTIGKEVTGVGSYDSSLVAVRNLLEDLNVSLTGFKSVDGSGLSRQNYVSTQFLCNYYKMISESTIFAQLFESLPVAGGPGTLRSVLKNESSEVKSKIHAKSGSLSGVRCYAGYVEGGKESGLVRFAIFLNNYSAPTSKVQPLVEKFLLELTKTK